MPDALRPSHHHNNPLPPDDNSDILLICSDAREYSLSPQDLQALPASSLQAQYFHTDHGRHGPYNLLGVSLLALIQLKEGVTSPWQSIELISADGFGNRVLRQELEISPQDFLLCYQSNGKPLTRENGLVRLVVASEQNSALRQVKWLRLIRVR